MTTTPLGARLLRHGTTCAVYYATVHAAATRALDVDAAAVDTAEWGKPYAYFQLGDATCPTTHFAKKQSPMDQLKLTLQTGSPGPRV